MVGGLRFLWGSEPYNNEALNPFQGAGLGFRAACERLELRSRKARKPGIRMVPVWSRLNIFGYSLRPPPKNTLFCFNFLFIRRPWKTEGACRCNCRENGAFLRCASCLPVCYVQYTHRHTYLCMHVGRYACLWVCTYTLSSWHAVKVYSVAEARCVLCIVYVFRCIPLMITLSFKLHKP